jgi:hypothetical protein
VPFIPAMLTGATDGRFTNAAGVPTYGLSGLMAGTDGDHIHGLNERIQVKALMNGRQFLYEVVKLYADGAKMEGPGHSIVCKASDHGQRHRPEGDIK